MNKTIINPETGKNYYITSKKGLEILEKYYQKGGNSECNKYNNEPIKCHSHKTSDGKQCLYKKKGETDGNCYKKSSRIKKSDELFKI